MKPRRWLPYQHLQSRNLGLALATTRVIAWIGMLLIAAGIAYGIATAIPHFTRPASAAGQLAVLAIGTVVGLIGYGLAALVLSGSLAALVGIEESQRRQTGPD